MIALAFMSAQELLIVALIVLVLFGATKLPKLASSIGESVKNFKRGMREAEAEEQKAKLQADEHPKALEADNSASSEEQNKA